MSYADLQRKQFHWQQLFGLLDKLPIWAGYFFAILCSFGMGYSLGSCEVELSGSLPGADHCSLR